MQNLGANVLVLVLGQLKQPVPEVRLVRSNLARAHLLAGLQSDLWVRVPRQLDDGVDVLSVPDLGHELA